MGFMGLGRLRDEREKVSEIRLSRLYFLFFFLGCTCDG